MQIGLTVSNAPWGGPRWFLVSYALWWLGTLAMLTITILVTLIFTKESVTSTKTISPALALPFVGTATDALVGAVICNYSSGVTPRLAVPVIIFSYILAGAGFLACLLIYSAYFVRLMNYGPPPAEQTPSMVILVGPSGQSAAAAQALGTAAMKYFGDYNKGTFLQAEAGRICETVGVIFGMMFVGLGLLFMIFALWVLLERAILGEYKAHGYGLIWWSTIFPIATVNTAFIFFAKELDSPAFRVLAAMFLVGLLVVYFVNVAFTLRDIFQRKLLRTRGPSPPPQQVRDKES
jgi:tellurite resistance protein TehA-like permease